MAWNDPLGEANSSPISDNEAELQVLTQISTGENQLIFEGFYLDGRAPLGGGFDVSFRIPSAIRLGLRRAAPFPFQESSGRDRR
ncbi:MAG TPA: hypothetical protein VFV58_10295 [Blastocatellia bacterium]|nr:hypothetical protein [Blastocatellia bacterium]